MPNNNKPVSRQANVVAQELENEILVYDLKINKAYCLNQTSALVYNLADGTKNVAEISDLMSIKLKNLVSEDIVYLALNELKKNNLLENANEMPNYFGGLSRREVVKKVGFASMVMLPIISSVVAPNAAMAQSGCPGLGAACTFANNTQSNCCNSNLRCWDSAGVNPTCRTCFAPGAGPQAVCSTAGCCAGRPDANKCCSNSYTETLNTPTNFLCFCA